MKLFDRICSAAICIASLSAVLPTTVFAETAGGTYGYLRYEIIDGEITVTGCSQSARGNIEIPSIIDGYPVTDIATFAFTESDEITGVTIPYSMKNINSWTFAGCENLTEVIIPDSVTDIGEWAFYNCRKLSEITIPSSVTSIGDFAFSSCIAVSEIKVDEENEVFVSDENGVLYTKDKKQLLQFPLNSKLTEYAIPDGVVSIGAGAFMECGLTNVTIPDSVVSIGNSAFGGCSELTSIAIPRRVKSIGVEAFAACDKLTEISVSERNNYFCSDKNGILFDKYMSALVQFPAGVDITSYYIPESVVSINAGAFSGCQRLTSVTIPESVTTIEKYIFANCYNLTDVYYAAGESKWEKIHIDENNNGLNNAALHFNIPAPNQYDIEYPPYLKYRISDWEITITKCLNEAKGTVEIPSEIYGYPVATIGDFAFEDCNKLSYIIIPNSITNIGMGAFLGCDRLETVYFAGSEEEWSLIDIERDNTGLEDAQILFQTADQETSDEPVSVADGETESDVKTSEEDDSYITDSSEDESIPSDGSDSYNMRGITVIVIGVICLAFIVFFIWLIIRKCRADKR